MQLGGEVMNVILILRTKAALKTFENNTQVTLGDYTIRYYNIIVNRHGTISECRSYWPGC